MILVLVLVLIIVIGVVLFFVLRPKDTPAPAPSPRPKGTIKMDPTIDDPGLAIKALDALPPIDPRAQTAMVKYVPIPPGAPPKPPAPALKGVTFWSGYHYTNTKKFLQPGKYRWIKDVGFPNDALRSIQVPSGCRLILYQHINMNEAPEDRNGWIQYIDQGKDIPALQDPGTSSFEIICS